MAVKKCFPNVLKDLNAPSGRIFRRPDLGFTTPMDEFEKESGLLNGNLDPRVSVRKDSDGNFFLVDPTLAGSGTKGRSSQLNLLKIRAILSWISVGLNYIRVARQLLRASFGFVRGFLKTVFNIINNFGQFILDYIESILRPIINIIETILNTVNTIINTIKNVGKAIAKIRMGAEDTFNSFITKKKNALKEPWLVGPNKVNNGEGQDGNPLEKETNPSFEDRVLGGFDIAEDFLDDILATGEAFTVGLTELLSPTFDFGIASIGLNALTGNIQINNPFGAASFNGFTGNFAIADNILQGGAVGNVFNLGDIGDQISGLNQFDFGPNGITAGINVSDLSLKVASPVRNITGPFITNLFGE